MGRVRISAEIIGDHLGMAQWRTTEYFEFVGSSGAGMSPEISIANDASWATRIFDVAWAQQKLAVDDFLGYARVVSTGSSYPDPSGYIARTTPMPFPFYVEEARGADPKPANPKYALFCTKINRIQGLGLPDVSPGNPLPPTPANPAPIFDVDINGLPLAAYNTARMELGFESLLYDILEDTDPAVLNSSGITDESLLTRYVTKIPGPSSDYITLNYGILQYAEGANKNSAVPFAPGKIVVTHDLRYRWELVPKEAVPSLAVNPLLAGGAAASGGQAAIEFTLGRVNQANFGGYPPGTLLLTAASIVPIRGPLGRRLFTVEYFMKFLPTGHHKLYVPLSNSNPFTMGWGEVSTDGEPHPIHPTTPDGVHIYDVADFAWLFRPPNNATFPGN